MTLTRKSRKREAIYAALCSTKSHPSAEWIYAKVKAEVPDLSLGTVYRNLSRFAEEGKIARIATVNGQERFDADTSGHAHFVCRLCGRVMDVHGAPEIESPNIDAVIEGYQLNYYGRCGVCADQDA